ncbi:PQQ-dependent sugar dehydrogenase [Aestuariibaculum marinum]|uniref:PQQ-dependent sugar dehydrogenase n=1 Tax=Aestuariibaculum marinum TaxID=2683592 RepID=UPI0019D666E1|nr:PQQ-dependent sugar dehydrogenase [Aestuariibaculum marinum]
MIIILLFSVNYVFSQEGLKIYSKYCVGCHAPNLRGVDSKTDLFKNRFTKKYIERQISQGIPNTTMVSWKNILSADELSSVAEYILSFQDNDLESDKKIKTDTVNSEQYKLVIQSIVGEKLKTPWAIEFISRDSALISEKRGSLKWMINNVIQSDSIEGLPKTYLKSSTGGYMDIALDPDYEKNKFIYLAYSFTNGNYDDKNALALTKIVRAKIIDNQWTSEQTLFEVPDSLMVRNGNRWGCRLYFDPEGYLFFSIGDMGRAMDSQDLSKATGKIFRIHADGSIPEDNPFADRSGVLKAIYSIGNRNVQGIDRNPQTGDIWASEHGPRGGDELNIINKGDNYGWPLVTYGLNYNGSVISDKTHMEGMVQPVTQWTPSIAVCPILFVSSDNYTKWDNNLLVGALAFQELRRLVIKDDEILKQEIIWKGKGRIRDIKLGKDKFIYVVTNGPDRVLKILPY